jgi:hypothetical protein
MRQEIRALLGEKWLLTIGAAIVLGYLTVSLLESFGQMVVGLIEAEPDESFVGGAPNSFSVGNRVVHYGSVLSSALALASAILGLVFLTRWLNRSHPGE